jgi:hypothetical protein
VLIPALIAISGCASDGDSHKRVESTISAPQTVPSATDMNDLDQSPGEPSAMRAETPSPENANERVLAGRLIEGLIVGLDGELYEPYHPKTIEVIQFALRARGVYGGPVNGTLDLATMRAIYVFQRATGSLQLCGIPTPRTRKILEQGSHTDVG